MTSGISFESFARSALAVALYSAGVSVLVCLLNAASLGQDTFTAGSGLWSTTTNWSLGRLPMSSDNCVIPGGSTVTADAGGECLNLTIGTGASVTITGYIDVYGASLVNAGTIYVGSLDGLNFLGTGTQSVSGGGTINYNTASSRTLGNGNTVVNVDNTIHGEGSIGAGSMAITNEALIDANSPSHPLAVQSNGAGVTNTGVIQASGGGNLQLPAGFLTIPFNNTGGTIQALNGSVVTLAGYTYTGGKLSTTGTGSFQIVPANNVILNNLTIAGLYEDLNDANTTLHGTVTNNGTIQALNGGVLISGSATLKGTGVLTGNSGQLLGSFTVPTSALLNQSTIQGGGTIGDQYLTITNQGTIDANSKTNPLTTAGNPLTNSGVLEASGGGTLIIGNTVKNSAIITAQTGSKVILRGTVSGGTLASVGTGSFVAQDGTLDGTTNPLTNTGVVKLSGFSLNVQGTINNTGTIALQSAGGFLAMTTPTVLTGSGKITMTTNNSLFGAGNSLTNQSTIQGAGSVGDSNPMPITNHGTILANLSSPLYIVPDVTGFTNTGKLIVNPGSTLEIRGTFNNLSTTGTLSGGTYTASGTLGFPANVVTNGAAITLSGGTAEILNTNTLTNALSALATNTSAGVLTVQKGQALTTGTTFSNSGKTIIAIGSSFASAGGYTQAAGATTVDGTLTAPGGLNLKAGSLVGLGTVAATVTSGASITAGDSATKPGKLSIQGTFTQNSTGTLNISVGGTAAGKFGELAVTNGASLGGTLALKLVNGFTPVVGDSFTMLTGSAVSGKFATVKGASINSSEHFQVDYSATAVTLAVVSGP